MVILIVISADFLHQLYNYVCTCSFCNIHIIPLLIINSLLIHFEFQIILFVKTILESLIVSLMNSNNHKMDPTYLQSSLHNDVNMLII